MLFYYLQNHTGQRSYENWSKNFLVHQECPTLSKSHDKDNHCPMLKKTLSSVVPLNGLSRKRRCRIREAEIVSLLDSSSLRATKNTSLGLIPDTTIKILTAWANQVGTVTHRHLSRWIPWNFSPMVENKEKRQASVWTSCRVYFWATPRLLPNPV